MAISKEIRATRSSEQDGLVIEAADWASRSTFDIIGVAGMGRDFNAIVNPENDLLMTYRSIFRPTPMGQFLGILGFFLPSWIIRTIPQVSRMGLRNLSLSYQAQTQ
jgi:hypothetical protein